MSKPRIMVVEDEKVVAADIAACVEGLGYEVVGSAASGTEAVRLAVQTEPDLVLMDIKLKGLVDGIEVAGALYDQLRIPVVYLTAHADAEILERAKKTAPSGYVLKPFDDRALRTAIEIAFDRHRRERQLIEVGERLATAIGSIDEAVVVTQESGQVAVMNRVAEALTGWNQEQALGKPVGAVVTVLNALTGAPLASPLGRVLREGISIGLGENAVLLSRQGTRTAIQGSATPVRSGENAVGVCLLFRAAGRRSGSEPWGAPDHGSTSRMEILGRLTAAVAQKFSSMLEAGKGRTRAVRLASRLLEFGQRQPGPPIDLYVNDLLSGLDDLLQCALGDEVLLRLNLDPMAGRVRVDPGEIELLLMHMAICARENGPRGEFSITSASVASELSPDACAILTVEPPRGGHAAALALPALDEIVRHSFGEIRLSGENGALKIYLPALQ
ncbi:MAG TPA: response regulator [Bryobacteraceae bacterium]|nr:response regulator [Bryobacteraceae bacterium]